MLHIYIASSWKNVGILQELAVILREEGFNVDLFCDDSTGRFRFCYEDIPDNRSFDAISFLTLPDAQRAFHEDKKWLDWCDVCILVLPSGRSAHLEAGYAVGRGKRLFILGGFKDGEFDVMYGFADGMFSIEDGGLDELIKVLKVLDRGV